MITKKIFTLIYLFTAICACTSNSTKIQKFSDFPTGKILNMVKCKADSSINYCLYLPSSYTNNKKFPVVFIFDSHANGRMPVKMYKNIAEKFSCILVGSNNSQNGMLQSQTLSIANTNLLDVKKRINIDTTRIYTMGFSGGARVASSVAIFNNNIRGVIACSGGLPSENEEVRTNFDFIAIAGLNDFNYNEMKILDVELSKTPIRHILFSFDGTHQWPDSATIYDAFMWLNFNEMKDKVIPTNDSIIRNFIKNKETQLKNADILSKYNIYSSLISFLNGLYNTDFLKKKLAEIEKNKDYLLAIETEKGIEQKEISYQGKYLEIFRSKTTFSWKDEIGKLKNLAKTSKSISEKAMFNRCLAYLSILGYSFVNSALQNKDLQEAEICLKIYESVDPQNPDVYYFYAKYYAMKNEDDNSLKNLQKAVDIGFTDITKIKDDELLKHFAEKIKFPIKNYE